MSAYLEQMLPNATVIIHQLQDEMNKMERELDRNRTEIDRLKAERRWIPVSERLPENRKQILVFIDGIPDYEGNSLSRITESYYDEKFVCWLGEYVTHWMPLPAEPPSEEEC